MKQITVIGVGGCGSNILRQMQHAGVVQNQQQNKLTIKSTDRIVFTFLKFPPFYKAQSHTKLIKNAT